MFGDSRNYNLSTHAITSIRFGTRAENLAICTTNLDDTGAKVHQVLCTLNPVGVLSRFLSCSDVGFLGFTESRFLTLADGGLVACDLNGSIQLSISLPGGEIPRYCAVSSKHNAAVLAGHTDVVRADLATGHLSDRRSYKKRPVKCAAIHARTGRTLVLYSGDRLGGPVLITDSEPSGPKTLEGEIRVPEGGVFSGDGRWLVSVRNLTEAERRDRPSLRLWRTEEFGLVRELAFNGPANRVFFSDDGGFVACAGMDPIHLGGGQGDRVVVFETDRGDLAFDTGVGDDRVLAAEFLPNSRQIVVGTESGFLHVYDVRSGLRAHSADTGGGPILSIGLAPDGTTIATGHMTGELQLRSAL